jgi:3-oxoacyl-[acyl-carrier protein] reductase
MSGRDAAESLEGRVAWITGAGSGIGRATARTLAARGVKVTLTARGAEGLQSLREEIERDGGEALVARADVTSEAEVSSAADAIRARFGRLDILLVNAGAAVFRPFDRTTPDEWNRVIGTNLTGAFLTIRAALPLFAPEGGDLLTMVSIAGRRPFADNSAYCASKYGLLGLTEVLRSELRPRGIRVTALIPGATDTPLWDEAAPSFDRSRMMRAESVAAMIVAAVAADRSAAVEWIQMQPAGGSL